jgi:hypothetical protein
MAGRGFDLVEGSGAVGLPQPRDQPRGRGDPAADVRDGPFHRTHIYFGDRADVERSYRAAARFVGESGCRSIGLDLSAQAGNQYEYVWLVLLRADGARRVRAIGITNGSGRYRRGEETPFHPCAVVCVHCAKTSPAWKDYAAASVRTGEFDDVMVFITPPANAATGGRPVGPPPLTAAGVQELRELFPRLPKLDTEDRPGAIP